MLRVTRNLSKVGQGHRTPNVRPPGMNPHVFKRAGVADRMKPDDKIYSKGGPIHMYASKENAYLGYVENRGYSWIRAKDTWDRFWSDKSARYFYLGMMSLIGLALIALLDRSSKLREVEGLIGPKRKAYRSRLTVVLDVDETLVSFGDKAYRLRANLVPRPYLAELLDFLASIDAEVILWSASTDRYMKAVVHSVDPTGFRVSHYITRDYSWYSKDSYYEKNIDWLKRNNDDVLIVENRPMSVRGCNKNAVLVDDFIRGEYIDTGRDHPPNDHALRTIKEIVNDLDSNDRPVQEYLADRRNRHHDIKDIPCHLAMRQMPDEMAVGDFYFIGEKYKPGHLERSKVQYKPEAPAAV